MATADSIREAVLALARECVASNKAAGILHAFVDFTRDWRS